MKHLNFNNLIHALLALIIIYFIFSCQKDEEVKEPVKVATENRTGQNELVFFSRSGLFASSDETDTIQTVINLKYIDSITYNTNWQSPSITIYGVECWEYKCTFYRGGNVVFQQTAFTKFAGIKYKHIISQNEGFVSDIFRFDLIRHSDMVTEFNRQCLKIKRGFLYTIYDYYINGDTAQNREYMFSQNCANDRIIYPRIFK
ncbi:MAG: hypothetical protein IPN10_03060 [Saprospiraceae bacterium]|nr:hypothetical protein [Saprospiraceae bacterium]